MVERLLKVTFNYTQTLSWYDWKILESDAEVWIKQTKQLIFETFSEDFLSCLGKLVSYKFHHKHKMMKTFKLLNQIILAVLCYWI